MDFLNKIAFDTYVEGTINSEKFSIKGEGFIHGGDGTLEGNFVCETGTLPLDWNAVAQTLGYGTKVFVQYPTALVDFFKQCMPQGYSQERIVSFEHDGTIHAYQDVTMDEGKIINKVTLIGTGFRNDSPVLVRNMQMMMPSIEYTFPYNNGIKSVVHHVYPLKDRDGCIVAEQTTINKPLGEQNISIPPYHHIKTHIKQDFTPASENGGKEKVRQTEKAVASPNFEFL